MYIWEKDNWPLLKWDGRRLARLVAAVSRDQGRLLGRMEALGADLRREAQIQILTGDVVKSGEIDAEALPPGRVQASIARRLGMIKPGRLDPADRAIEGAIDVILDATANYAVPLTAERLFRWHASLYPTARSGMRTITVGNWRDDATGPIQVVSGPPGREKVLFEAPPAERVPAEMAAFLRWFEQPGDMDPLLIAGLAHLWFATIHPFDDGNGRIARSIADLALARSEGVGQRFYSLSAQIRRERDDYYMRLEWAQKGELDVTRWLGWFLNCLHRAIAGAEEALATVLAKARFWERYARESLNERQIKMLNRLIDDGFEGKLTSSQWARMTRSSQDTAQRDIADLIRRGALKKDPGGGRSTSYSLAM